MPQTQPLLSRRNLIRIAVSGGVLLPVLYLSFGSKPEAAVIRRSVPMMGTTVNLTVIGETEQTATQAVQQCLATMQRLSLMLSTYVADSPLSRLNATGELEDPPQELLDVVSQAVELGQLTGGAFDPTVYPLVSLFREVTQTGRLPEQEIIEHTLQLVDYRHIIVEGRKRIRFARPGVRLTLDGIAKGYIVDRGVDILRSNGIGDAFVEAGGDLMAIGHRRDGQPWRIGIRNPRSDDLQKMDMIALSGRAIATSGDYMQYFTSDRKVHHIINPATGFSPLQLASSSILAPTVARADGLATASMVLGAQRSIELLETLPACEGFFIDKDLNKFQTRGFFS